MMTAGLAANLRIRAMEIEHDKRMPATAALMRQAADALERQSAAPAHGTVRVVAAGVVNSKGEYSIVGWANLNKVPDGDWRAQMMDSAIDVMEPDQYEVRHWITADLPMPVAQEIAGRVEGA